MEPHDQIVITILLPSLAIQHPKTSILVGYYTPRFFML